MTYRHNAAYRVLSALNFGPLYACMNITNYFVKREIYSAEMSCTVPFYISSTPPTSSTISL
uniref:Uncharacterized protein n=1 Tax=Megaselia scalaris TaxID=36166 RepID=T1GZZ9_MEGSC